MTKTWLITGCSTGFGRLLAQAALDRGDQVVATARSPATLSDMAKAFPKTARTIALDVTKAGDAEKAVAVAMEAFGRLDVLVNNAGFGFIGAIEEATPDDTGRCSRPTSSACWRQPARPCRRCVRPAPVDRIVNMSSGAGIKGLQGSGHYNATKFAVEGISEALAQEVAPFGIAVIIVEPGPFRTDFLGRSISAAKKEMPEYAATAGVFRTFRANNDGKQVGDPDKAVKVMLKVIDLQKPPLHLPLGARAFALARAKIAELRRTSTPGRRWPRRPTTSETARG